MKRNSPVIRKDDMEDQTFAERTAIEEVLRGDQLVRAAKLLEQEEFRALKLHDVEGMSLESLCEWTGLPPEAMEAHIDELRNRFAHHIQVEARSWRKQLDVVEGYEK